MGARRLTKAKDAGTWENRRKRERTKRRVVKSEHGKVLPQDSEEKVISEVSRL
jgi:hypothetical protein